MEYPQTRMRRLRQNESWRKLVREHELRKEQLVMPYFVTEGKDKQQMIGSMPGQFRYSLDRLLPELETLLKSGVSNILLFGLPQKKDESAASAYQRNGIIQRSVRSIKKRFPEILVMTDVCLCEYMSHGHCGIVRGERVLNDETLDLLQKTALSHAEAGADLVAPSDMMDGRVASIRRVLDQNGFDQVPIMSYAAKFASAFYGPFREAANSAPKLGDRKSYQMDPSNRREALREIELDVREGADIVMIKPALAYLDILREASQKWLLPFAAYNVSGEYSMVKAAAQAGYIDEPKVVLETLLSIKRAGADIIISYHAKEAARWLS